MTVEETLSVIWDRNVFMLTGYHTAVFYFFILFWYIQYFILHDSFVINLGNILSFFLNRILFSGTCVSSCFCYIEDILIFWRNILPSKRLEQFTLWHFLTSQNTWILSSSNSNLPRSDPIQTRTILSNLQIKCVFTIPLFQYDHRLYFGCAASIFALSHCYSQRTYEMTHRSLKLCWRYFN